MNPIHRVLGFTGRVLRVVGTRLELVGKTRNAYQEDIPARDQLIRLMFQRMEAGESWEAVIREPAAIRHSERVVEYTYVWKRLREIQPRRLLDVGCVMNNPVIDPAIGPACETNFLNPALEPLVRKEAIYHVGPLGSFCRRENYDLVTCLSTLEHIGFDNTRYGTKSLDEGWEWDRCIAEFVRSLKLLRGCTDNSGTILISAPFGRREFVRLPPVNGPRVWQVIHEAHLAAMRSDSELADAKVAIFKLGADGWGAAGENESHATFGSVGSAASAVIIIEMKGTGGSLIGQP